MNNKFLSLIAPRYWPAWLGLSLLWLITRLPFSWQFAIGRFFGRIFYSIPSQFKTITQKNIDLCFPELSPHEKTDLIKKNFASLGIGLIETGIAWWVTDERLRNLYKVHGLGYAASAFAKGKGVILLGPHFTSLELVGRLLGMHYSFAVMFRPHKKPLVSFIHERFRKKTSIKYIPRHRMRELLRTLAENQAIWYAYDVDGGPKRSVFAPFFGIKTASLTAATRIVELSGATIIPISFYRRDNEFGYDIFLEPPLDQFPSECLVEDATRLNATLEKAIRKKPEQYVWQYKRFKTRPKGEQRFY